MSKLLNLNYFSSDISNSFSAPSVSVAAGTLTNHTNPNKLINRNIADAYVFTPSNTTTLKIEINVSILESFKSMGILGSNLTTFSLYKDFFLPENELTQNTTISRKRSEIGNPNTYDDAIVDTISLIDNVNTLTLFFEFDVTSGNQYTIGTIWGSDSLDFKISPASLDFSPTDTSQVDYSNGGQKYVSTGNVINTIKFNIPKLTHDEAKGNTGSIDYINNTSGIAHPLIIIPYENDNMLFYGTQKTLAKLTPLLANDGATEWFYKASMVIEEEL